MITAACLEVICQSGQMGFGKDGTATMKHGQKRFLATLLAFAMCLSLVSVQAFAVEGELGGDPVSTADGAYTKDFTVLSTTDVHGKVWNQNVLNDTSVNNSLLRVSTAVKGIRADYEDDAVFLIDNGDLYQGTPVSSYHISQMTQYLKNQSTSGLDPSFIGSDGTFNTITPMALALKYIGYDASVLGNHEFNYAWDTMKHIYDWMELGTADTSYDPVAVLAANLYWTETKGGNTAGENVFKPYIIKEIDVDGQPFQVGILGLENTDCTRWDIADNYPNISFSAPNNPTRDMAIEAEKYVTEMKDAGCDFIILSYHSGRGEPDGDLSFGTNTEGQILRVISKTEGIDMVIAGHDHSSNYSNKPYPNKNGEDVLIVNAGGTSLTQSTFTITKQGGEISVGLKNSQNLNLSKYSDDADLEALIAPYAAAAGGYVNQTVGALAGNWNKVTQNSCYTEQSDTVDLINRSQIDRGGAYLSAKYGGDAAAISTGTEKFLDIDATKAEEAATGGARPALDHLTVDLSCTSIVFGGNYPAQAGDLTMKGIYKFYKYDNSLYLIPITGAEIESILEWNAANRLSGKIVDGEPKFSTIGDSFTNPVFYGVDFTYDLSKDPGDRVTITQFADGRPFEPDKTYILAVNNYHLGNGPFAAYTTGDAIWSQTDDLGGGVVQDLIAEFVGNATQAGADIQPAPSKWALIWTGSTGPDLSKATAIAYPIPTTEMPADGDTIYLHHPASGTAIGSKPEIGGLAATSGSALQKGVLYPDAGAMPLTVQASGGSFYLIYDGKYLTSAATGNGLTLEAAPSDYSLWFFEAAADGWNIGNANAAYNGSKQYLEYYNKFTTFTLKNTDAYVFDIYKAVPSGAKLSAAPQDGDKIVIYNTPNLLILGSAASGSRLKGVEAINAGDLLPVPEGSAVFTVSTSAGTGEYDGKTLYTLTCGGKYLTYGSTGNSLTLADTASELSLWGFDPIEGGWRIHAANAAYTGSNGPVKNQYLEQYGGNFTTYGWNGGGDNYIFDLYAFDDSKGFTPEAPDVPDVPEDPEAFVLPVYETTDVHGFLVDVSSGDPSAYEYRMAYIANTVNGTRKGDANTTILLDSGDIYQGNVISNLQDGKPMVAAYDMMKYDAVGLGNHEFDWGIYQVADHDGTMTSYTDLSGNTVDSALPILACNIYASSPEDFVAGTTPRVDFTQDYVILEKTAVNAAGETITVNVAVVGYAPDYRSDIMPARIADYTLHADLSIPEGIARQLKDEGKCDAAILLVHDGASSTAGKLAADTAFDLVLGGHTHQNSTGVSSKGLVYLQTKNQANGYGYVELRFGADKSLTKVADNKIVTITEDRSQLQTGSSKLDADIKALSDRSIAGVSSELNTTLGYIVTPATKSAIKLNDNTYSDSSTAGNWMTDMQNRGTGAQASFTNNGGIRTEFPLADGAASRTIAVGDIYTIAPFDNELYVYDVTYADFKDFFENYLTKSKTLALRMAGPQVYYTGTTVNSIVLKDAAMQDVVVYDGGVWAEGYDTARIRLSFNSYVATSVALLKEWNGTDKLVSKNGIDNVSYISALKEEYAATGGLLYVDPNPYIISGTYAAHDHDYQTTNTVTAAEGITGYTEYACSVCGYSYIGGIVKALTPYTPPSGGGGGGASTTTPPATVVVGTDSVKVELGSAAALTKEQAQQLVTQNATKDVVITGTALSVVIPAGTLSSGADINAMIVDPTDKGDVIQVTLKDGTTIILPFAVVGNGTAAYIASIEGTYKIVSNSKSFSDIGSGHWAADAIGFVTAHEFFNGTGGGSFSPNELMTRSMLVTVLHRVSMEDATTASAFPDVARDTWYTDAVDWAAASGVVTGTGAGFDPDGSITREQLCTILVRFMEYAGIELDETASTSGLNDLGTVSSWAGDSMELCVKYGLITGKPGGLSDPQGTATRAEIAAILARFVQAVVK